MTEHKTLETLHSEAVISLLRDLTRLVRFQTIREAQKSAHTAINTREKKLVFSLTDGSRSVRQIAAKTGVNKNTISDWWRDWHADGLVEVVPGTKGTKRTVFSVDELGLAGKTNDRQ